MTDDLTGIAEVWLRRNWRRMATPRLRIISAAGYRQAVRRIGRGAAEAPPQAARVSSQHVEARCLSSGRLETILISGAGCFDIACARRRDAVRHRVTKRDQELLRDWWSFEQSERICADIRHLQPAHGAVRNSPSNIGVGGTVTTDVGGEFSQEEALGVAMQPDGKIVVGGYTNGGDVTVARYQSDGELDDTFGTGGIVSGVLRGQANDVVIQPDGRIVFAGTATVDNAVADDFSDFFVARFLPDGQLDHSFGLGGIVVTDVGGLSNEAQNVVLAEDGVIVVSGSSLNSGRSGVGIDHHTDIARYRADGQPDSSFGTGGTLNHRRPRRLRPGCAT